MRQVIASVVANERVAAGTHVLRLREPHISAHALPGQFVHIRCVSIGPSGPTLSDPLLRRPLSILECDDERREFAVLLDVVGRGTDWLSRVPIGEELDVLGPLGRPFELRPTTRRALMIGGGIGIVPLVALARQAAAKDVEVTLVAGFRDESKVIPATLVPSEAEYVVATDDGSVGRQGFATVVAADYLAWADQVFACGPLPMLRALARMDRPRRLPVQVSMEEHMGCAMGVCLGCVIRTRKGYERVCRDGPVFDINHIDWRESN
jgi:dihydroorotate dehydrogenase electron transfer subunit